MSGLPASQTAEADDRPRMARIGDTPRLTDRAYRALKDYITSLSIYDQPGEVRIDERQLAENLGISRTPVREAVVQLEREGFVRSVPRRGIYIIRKTKRDVIEMVTAWAALESMAARLATLEATDEQIASLRAMFSRFEDGEIHAKLDEYSDANIRFHQSIIDMSHNSVLIGLAENLFAQMRMIRHKTIGELDRAERSIRDHMAIIHALEARETEHAEDLVRRHALGLAEHIAQYADHLETS
jgi:DNA-binding GntR family transcriptional regulator